MRTLADKISSRRSLFFAVLSLATAASYIASSPAFASCGTQDITWVATNSTNWSKASNWSPANIPDSASENAIITNTGRTPSFSSSLTLGCVEIQSGYLTITSDTMTIVGDYFYSPAPGTLTATSSGSTIRMAGTGPQTLENYDDVSYVTISNPTSVTFPRPFTITKELSLSANGTTLYVNADLNLSGSSSVFTIPVNTTVNIASGVTLTALGGVAINGTLILNPGSQLVLGSGKTLQVNSTGLLRLQGSYASPAAVTGDDSNAYSVNIAGSLYAEYFRFYRMTTAGLNITGTVQLMDHGTFHRPIANSYAMTLGSSAILPSTMNTIAFFNEDAVSGARNIRASSYSGSAFTLSNWAGPLGGASFETDPNNRVVWGSQAGVALTVSNNTAVGNPPSTIKQSTGPTYFATFAFNLTGASSATDITQLTITQAGTASAGDIQYIRVMTDSAGGTNCVYNSGVDSQIGGDLTMSGSPPTATLSIPAGVVTTDGSAPACVHVLVRTTAAAMDEQTIQMQIAGTSDVVNSVGYPISESAAPPVTAGFSTIIGDAESVWNGKSSTTFNNSNNWSPKRVPSSTRDCRIGNGVRVATLTGNEACQNATLLQDGEMSLGSRELAVYGSLSIGANFVFSGSSSGTIAMRGAGNQTISINSDIPGALLIANTGSSPSNVVDGSFAGGVVGDLTVTSGVLRIPSGQRLEVQGNVTVQSGATLDIEAGGTLALGSGRTLTINSGATLSMVGSLGQTANVTGIGASAAVSVVVNGTIRAQYYNFDHLNTAGVTIQSGATIDSTYHLQDGSFSFPVNSSTQMLRLYRKIPGDNLSNMSFSSNGSSATGVTNIYTAGSVSAGTLTVSGYSGDWSGLSYSSGSPYVVAWAGATNTIDVQSQASGPASVNQGQTHVMGSFRFRQSQAGASFADTDLSSLRLTLTGTAGANAVSQARIYYDPACSGSGGTLLGTGNFVGSPPTANFSLAAGATIPASASSPPWRCLYVVYDVSANAVNGQTVGVRLDQATDVTTSQGYAVSGSSVLPIDLGTEAAIVGASTTWTGASSTNWFTAANWSGGVPTANLNCTIGNTTNKPVINGASGTAVCKTVNLTAGSLTMTNGTNAVLEVYGDVNFSGTFTGNDGTIRLRDNGSSATNQVLTTSSALKLDFNKTAGGTVRIGGSALSVTSLTLPSGSNFHFEVENGKTLTLPAGMTINGGTFMLYGGGTVKVASGKSITLNAGAFFVSGTNDAYPQTLTNKGVITNNGSGRWGFVANGGSVSLTGFLFHYLDGSGVRINGSTNLIGIDGGQFSHLLADYSTPVKVLQLNTTGTIATTATNVGWNWDAPNSVNGGSCCAPSTTSNYYLVYAPQCSGQALSFDQWFGDFAPSGSQVDTEAKIYDDADGGVCSVTIAASASPVSVLSLYATPYNGSVSIEWQTGFELDHLGFNVYRAESPLAGWVQMNSELIRNINSSSGLHGQYRFLDSAVTNDKTYYYYIEDISIAGQRAVHGSVFATPSASLSAAPSVLAPVNSNDGHSGSDSGNGPTTGPIATPGLIDLGNGVHLLAQTRNSMRLEIIPPAASYATSSWNPSYYDLTVPGYSRMTEAGYPALAMRTVLVEVDGQFSSAALLNSWVTQDGAVTKKISPAPSWSLNGGGVLVPSYSANPSAYAGASAWPSSNFELKSSLVAIGGKKFVQVNVVPVRYTPAGHQAQRASKIILDIGLDGSGWSTAPVSSPVAASPAIVPNTLKVGFKETGMYALRFDDLASAGVDGPFANISTSDLRLYFHGSEIPLEIESADGYFNSGDVLRFFVNFRRSFEDPNNYVILSGSALGDSSGAARRFAAVDADPTSSSDAPGQLTWRRQTAEQNNVAVFEIPVGTGLDHFYWKKLGIAKGAAPTSMAYLDVPLTLPALYSASNASVKLRVHVLSGRGNAVNATHHLGVFVNGRASLAADVSFNKLEPQVVTLTVGANQFFPGDNTIRLQAIGDLVPDGDWDVFYVDRVEAEYYARLDGSSESVLIQNPYADHVLHAYGFSSNSIRVYDVTDSWNILSYSNVSVGSTDSGATYFASFNTPSGGGAFGRILLAIESGQLKTAESLELNHGATEALRSNSRAADFIIIGPRALLPAVEALVTARRSEGMRVAEVSLEQIYGEFSNGEVSTEAVREFIRYARQSWQTPAPQYVLFVGDATFDPLDSYGHGVRRDVMPVPLEKGLYADFGSDNWFIGAENESGLPLMAVGRLPTSNPVVIHKYIEKLLDYESGTRAPLTALARKAVFVSDKETMSEGFAASTDSLASVLTKGNSQFSTTHLKRSAVSDAALKTEVAAAFENAPLFMTYLGHGAEDRWASSTVFVNTDAKALSNQKLPIVVALNCLNGYFYDADPAYEGLGEAMVLNETGGAVGFFGSTTLTSPQSQLNLATALLDEIAAETKQTPHTARVGDMLMRAKVALGTGPADQDTLRSYVWIGDPTLKVPASAFTGVANSKPAESSDPASPSSGADDSGRGGGGGGCGVVHAPRGSPGGGAPPPPLVLFIVLMPAILILYLRSRAESSRSSGRRI